MGLQARGTAGVDSASTGGTWDISNADRLGKSEIELVNIFIEGWFFIVRFSTSYLIKVLRRSSDGSRPLRRVKTSNLRFHKLACQKLLLLR